MKMTALLRSALFVMFAAFGAPTAANAEAVFETPQVRAELISEQAAAAPGESLWVAIKLQLKPEWHTYWRTTGDSGFPTTIDWTLPDGITASEIHWPVPERIPYIDLMNFGYHDEVLLLTELKIDETFAAPTEFELAASSTWLVCREICFPEDGVFSIPIQIDQNALKRDTPAGAEIAAARQALPQPAPWPVKSVRSGDILSLTAGPGVNVTDLTDAIYFPYPDGLIENAAPQRAAFDDGRININIPVGFDADSIAEAAGLIVVQSSSPDGSPSTQSFTFSSPIEWTGPAMTANAPAISVGLAILFAFLGGIILNAMPCVLPVLVMKALSFMSRSTTDARELRRDGLAYTAGVMVAFAVLVGALLGVRAGGTAVGWGFQLQTPAFVAILAYVMLAIGLNLSGVFTLTGGMGVGQNLTVRKGPSGAFFTGLLAVVVATPCTAPFMGAAMGFALTQPPIMSIIVFEALALGLALPYLVLAFAPGAAKALPKPGPWMDRLKQFLAFPMYAVAAWLFWVLAQQVDSMGLAAALSGFVLVGMAAWLWDMAARSSIAGRRVSTAAVLIVIATAIGLIIAISNRPPIQSGQALASDGFSEPFTQARLDALLAENRPVFVNFTAAWCITCKVNERVALSSEDVKTAFEQHNVAYLKADWTNRDDAIGSALRALGRDGVPLYALYTPGSREVEILPQILTPGLLVDAVQNF